MRVSPALRPALRSAAAGLGLLLVACAPAGPTPPPADWQSSLPPPEEAGLPALPETSPRNASYTIEARLDPEAHRIQGNLVLTWRNTTGAPQSRFPFHLYWNAFRNNRSTSAREEGRRSARPRGKGTATRGFGYTDVLAVALLGAGETDLTPSLRYIHPDDDNADDRTLMEVATPEPVPPGGTARFRIEWRSQVPYGDVGRAGWVHDYNFIAQWFPKIAGSWKGRFDSHQFHSTSEFFSDYGVYDVRLTLPSGFVVGATGRLEDRTKNRDGSETFHFVQEDIHDFAWTASRRFLERRARFEHPGYPPVEIRLLLQPEHASLAERYLAATRTTLLAYGAWAAPYPYRHITVVDPAWGSASGGMEYPTLFTGGAGSFAPPALQSPESVTIHEAGHQFWYGLVGNDEFEEAWLDEGFNTYMENRTRWLALGYEGWGRHYFGLEGRRRSGWPVVAPWVEIARGDSELGALRRSGSEDVMARMAWEYRGPESYYLNSYGKPALVLQTLENLLGTTTMNRVFRTYARRFRFGHPTTQDFIATVNEVTGRDWGWFFGQTFFSSQVCDYAVTVKVKAVPPFRGYRDGRDGRPVLASPPPKRDPERGPFDSEVTVERLGGVRMPVTVLMRFADGEIVTESWNGQDRWTRFRYRRPVRLVYAAVDPDRKLMIDVDPANNVWVRERGQASRAATKWAARWMLWLQNLLETQMLVG